MENSLEDKRETTGAREKRENQAIPPLYSSGKHINTISLIVLAVRITNWFWLGMEGISMFFLISLRFIIVSFYYERVRPFQLLRKCYRLKWHHLKKKYHWGKGMLPVMWSFLTFCWKKLLWYYFDKSLLFSSCWYNVVVWTNGKTRAAWTENSFWDFFKNGI